MNYDYCAVGPRFVLFTDAGQTAATTLTARAEERPGDKVAWLRAESHGDRAINIGLPQSPRRLTPADVSELLRLFVRVSADFWGHRRPLEVAAGEPLDPMVQDALRGDGFTEAAGQTWQRPASLFTRAGSKAGTLNAVYQDLFSVPWNFVPREWDVIGMVIAEAPTQSLAVLDLGCGVGKNVSPLASRGFAVHGVDSSSIAIRRCRAVVANVARPERFVVGSAAALPWRPAYFDRVLDVGALHCMPPGDRWLAVREIARVLKPGGLLYSRFFTPRPASWLQLQPMAVDRFGMTVDEVGALFADVLVCETVSDRGPAIYLRASRPNLR